ncbi:MAG TPA: PilZ domain-containing protein [Desulfonatronum sp.]|nr:PilZ domain-containing protein [Desulfonatronum sp.]
MSDQKRTYSRIETFLPARLRLLAPGEDHSLYLGCHGCDLPQPQTQDRTKTTGVPETLLDYLETINAKLDMLLSIANQDHLQTDFPVVASIVEISGAGLIFTADRDFQLDDRVEIVVFLSQVPLRLVGAIGRIHRRDQVDEKPAWVMDFTSIRESDREAVVRFVFQLQRERIRESKEWT